MAITDWGKEHSRATGFDMNCDICGETQFFERTYFADFIVDAKEAGWKVTKDPDGEWFHTCPKCVAKGE